MKCSANYSTLNAICVTSIFYTMSNFLITCEHVYWVNILSSPPHCRIKKTLWWLMLDINMTRSRLSWEASLQANQRGITQIRLVPRSTYEELPWLGKQPGKTHLKEAWHCLLGLQAESIEMKKLRFGDMT